MPDSKPNNLTLVDEETLKGLIEKHNIHLHDAEGGHIFKTVDSAADARSGRLNRGELVVCMELLSACHLL